VISRKKAIADYNIKHMTYTPSVFGNSKLKFREVDDVFVEDDSHLWMRKIQELICKRVDEKRAVLVFFYR